MTHINDIDDFIAHAKQRLHHDKVRSDRRLVKAIRQAIDTAEYRVADHARATRGEAVVYHFDPAIGHIRHVMKIADMQCDDEPELEA
jgi:hypothetical protein